MKKESTIISFLLLLLFFGCQKDGTKTTSTSTPSQSNQLSKNIFDHTDTTTSKFHRNTTIRKIGLDDNPTSLNTSVNYAGSGKYTVSAAVNENHDESPVNYYVFNAANNQSIAQINVDANGVAVFVNDASTQSLTITLLPGTYYLVAHYNYEEVNGEIVLNGPSFTIVPQPVAPSGMICLFRYFNTATGQHICTSGWEELGSVSEGFHYEKVLGYMYPNSSSAPNLQALYRYYDRTTGSHYVTNIYGTYSGFVYEQTLGYVGINSGGTLIHPIDKWYNASNYDHFNCVPPEVPNGTSYTKDVNFVCGYVQ